MKYDFEQKKAHIVILTSIYPQVDDEKNSGVTPVVHYFAKQWVQMGYDVTVIHNANKFISILYKMPNKLTKFINSVLGTVSTRLDQNKEIHYWRDGVQIYRVPIFKILPKLGYTQRIYNYHLSKIMEILDNGNRRPDICIGHWENPQIPLLLDLKKKYHVPIGIVFHDTSYIARKSWKNKLEYLKNDFDFVGARSKAIAKNVKDILNLSKMPFVCYSGIPNEYLNKTIDTEFMTDFNYKINKFIYVGRLIKRKNVDIIIKALALSHPDKDFSLDIVGIGAEYNRLIKLSQKYDVVSNITFYNSLTRDEVVKLMRLSQCFVMASRNEAFGLVYLEAMANGLITIGSKNEGIDGIIEDEENGFLVESGNLEDLISKIERIKSLSNNQRKLIAENAISTALKYSDKNVAEMYLKELRLIHIDG